jgi:hypothetical protein
MMNVSLAVLVLSCCLFCIGSLPVGIFSDRGLFGLEIVCLVAKRRQGEVQVQIP